MNFFKRASALLALTLVAGAALAQSDTPWDGFYFGLKAGGASSNTCNNWSSTVPTVNLSVSGCPGGAFVGGLDLGQNFQRKHLVYGLDLDVDAWASKADNRSATYTATAPPVGGAELLTPTGTYRTLGRLTPSDFIFVGPRVGYGGGNWFPYVKGGGFITSGSHQDGLSYTEEGATKPSASFQGGRNYASVGWAAGGGIEVGLHGALAFSAEYLHADLGKGGSSVATCSGVAPATTAAACGSFEGIAVTSTHGDFTANIFRVGITYYFQYWNP
jgi:outer membrane immunogenic protein